MKNDKESLKSEKTMTIITLVKDKNWRRYYSNKEWLERTGKVHEKWCDEETLTSKYSSSVERKNSIKAKGIRVVLEEINQRLKAKSEKIRRYENRINQYRQNHMPRAEQKKVCKELNGEILSERVIPDAEKSKKIWGELWGKKKEHKKEAPWLDEFMVMAAWLCQTMIWSAVYI